MRTWGVTADAAPDATSLPCPRCTAEATSAFYGPCATCRAELRRTMGGDAQARERAAFEPSMNVTPNAVALKE